MPPLFESSLPLPLRRGKVRDVYELDDRTLLIVASDRISAFDVIMPTPIPDKGQILTRLSNFWFNFFAQEFPGFHHHLLQTDFRVSRSPSTVCRPTRRAKRHCPQDLRHSH